MIYQTSARRSEPPEILRLRFADERPQVLDNIRNTPLPHSDPIFGKGGPLMERWGG